MKLVEKERCVGCFACEAVCPVKCIQKVNNADGFQYPSINNEQCLDCGSCKKVCPAESTITPCMEKSYAVYSKVKGYADRCSSGGVFRALSEYVLNNGGAVCAAAFSSKFSVEHIIVENIEESRRLFSSKYSQSYISPETFIKLKGLAQQKLVLFCGTPCQVHAIKNYIGDNSNLLTIDLVCHGVPSPSVWSKYLCARSEGKDIVDVNFRDKRNLKKGYGLSISFADGSSYYNLSTVDPYLQGFINNLYLRKSCYSCEYKGKKRKSDITLGDLWKAGKVDSRLATMKYVSWVIVHNTTGNELFQKIITDFNSLPISTDAAVQFNKSYAESPKENKKSVQFFSDLNSTQDVIQLIVRYCHMNIWEKIRRKVRNKLNRSKYNG